MTCPKEYRYYVKIQPIKPGLSDTNTHMLNWFAHKPWSRYTFKTVSLNRNNLEALLVVMAGAMLLADI